jgi:hypothetical protein
VQVESFGGEAAVSARCPQAIGAGARETHGPEGPLGPTRTDWRSTARSPEARGVARLFTRPQGVLPRMTTSLRLPPGAVSTVLPDRAFSRAAETVTCVLEESRRAGALTVMVRSERVTSTVS